MCVCAAVLGISSIYISSKFTMALFHIAGWKSCPFYVRALTALQGISVLFPSVAVKVHEAGDRDEFRAQWGELRSVCDISSADLLLYLSCHRGVPANPGAR